MSLFIIVSYLPSLGTLNKLPCSGSLSLYYFSYTNLITYNYIHTAGLVIGIGVFAAVILVIVVVTAFVFVGVIVISRKGRHKRLQGMLI